MTLWKLSAERKYLWFRNLNSAFSSQNYIIFSLFNYTISWKICSFAILNLHIGNSRKFKVRFADSNSSIFLIASSLYPYGSWAMNQTGLKQWMSKHKWWFSHYSDLYYIQNFLLCFVYVTYNSTNQAASEKTLSLLKALLFFFLCKV